MPRSASRSATGKLASPARLTSSMAASNRPSRASASAGASRLAMPATSKPWSSSMSSMLIATSISSSTMRMRSGPAGRSAKAGLPGGDRLERRVDDAAQAVGFEDEPRAAAEIGLEAALDQPRAEAALPGLGDRRSARLLPFERQPAFADAPADLHLAALDRQSAIFGGVGAELVQRQRQRQRRARRQAEGVAGDGEAARL